jgi:hypothetical protein
MRKFKVGDIVMVRNDLQVGKTYYNEDGSSCDIFSNMMLNHMGKQARIAFIQFNQYYLDIDKFHGYVDEMLESIEDMCLRKEKERFPNLVDENVEKIVNHMLRLVPEQLINHAIDTGNEELFKEVSEKYYSDDKCKK